MLLPEHRVLPLEGLQAFDLTGTSPVHDAPRGSTLEDPVPSFLPPPRQHDGMDVQGVGHRLHLHPRHAAQLHGRHLELDTVAMNLLRPDPSTHLTPPSVS